MKWKCHPLSCIGISCTHLLPALLFEEVGLRISNPSEAPEISSLEHKLVKELIISMLLQCFTSCEPGPTETPSKLMAKAEEPPAARKVRQNVPFTSATGCLKGEDASPEFLLFYTKALIVPSYKAQKYFLGFLHLLPKPLALKQNRE